MVSGLHDAGSGWADQQYARLAEADETAVGGGGKEKRLRSSRVVARVRGEECGEGLKQCEG